MHPKTPKWLQDVLDACDLIVRACEGHTRESFTQNELLKGAVERTERFDQALDQAAQSGKFDPWLKRVDADIDAGRVKPLNVWRQARSAASLACYQAI